MRIARTTAAAAATALAAFTLAACGGDDADHTAEPSTAPASSTIAAPSTTAPSSTTHHDVVAPEAGLAALRTAAAAVPDGQPFDLEVQTRDGQQQFEAKVAANGAEFKVIVDASGERVLSQTQSERVDDDVAKLEGTQVDAVQALETANGREAGQQLQELEIDTNADGVVIWEVELVRADGSEVEYTIDAHTGEVLSP